MSGKTPMLSFDDALSRVLALASPVMEPEHVELDGAEGRVLAEDLRASTDLPEFDYSAMDGYAVCARALGGATQVRLRVSGESRTGAPPDVFAAGTAMRIFTGAAVPEGADAVVMQEDTERDGDHVWVRQAVRLGQHVRRRGEDLAADSLALARGTRLGPAQLALCAALDRAEVRVARRPVVSIVATGDELRAPGSPRAPGSVAESNTIALRAMARHAGAVARVMPYVHDERIEAEHAFGVALAQADVVVSVGGMSVGDHDLARPALAALGVEFDFWRVAIKPGKPIAVGRAARAGKRDAIVIGLPGNPSSALVTFGVFGVPLLRALQGDRRPIPAYVRARAAHACEHKPGRLEFVRATLGRDADGSALVTPLGNQASGAPTTLAHADALMIVPADSRGVAAGESVDVLPLAGLGC
jgi:molybdopterin molybdotransferase